MLPPRAQRLTPIHLAVLVLLGVPFEQAALAAILFRVVYYFIPFLISLGLYWRLLRQRPSAA